MHSYKLFPHIEKDTDLMQNDFSKIPTFNVILCLIIANSLLYGKYQ